MAGPLFLKQAVDVLSSGAADALTGAVRAVATFGLCGVIQHLSKELQHPTFTPVSQVRPQRLAGARARAAHLELSSRFGRRVCML